MPRQRVTLVEKGVAKNLVYSRSSARKMGTEPTGHGFPLPNEMGEAPMNVVFEPGKNAELKTIEQMIASTEHGVLVTRLWYIREVDPYEKILTGMTRDGTFYVKDGKIQLNTADEIVRDTLLTRSGEVVNTRLREFFQLPALATQGGA